MAEDRLSDVEIAAWAGLTRRTLTRWRHHPDFAARVAAIVAAERAAVLAKGIAEKQNRVDAQDERWRAMRTLIAARAEDLGDEVPGGATGLLVRQAKIVKVYAGDQLEGGESVDGEILVSAKRSQVIYEYALDAGLLKELRELEKQAAQEVGQWTERREDTHELSDSFLDALREFGRADRA